MSTYLVTWNPAHWSWTELSEQAQLTRQGNRIVEPWSCGKTKRIIAGERLFLLKQGAKQPKGIIASGISTSDVYEDRHWNENDANRGRMSLYVGAEWDTILDPESELLLQVDAIESEGMPSVHWNTQSSGIQIPARVAERMEVLWQRHVEELRGSSLANPGAGFDPEEIDFPEGRLLYRLHRERERNSILTKRAKALAFERDGKLACAVCGFDFFDAYGDVGEGFIECHHTIPVSELRAESKTRLRDVVLVCSNCHRMLHRKRPWLQTRELRLLIQNRI